MNFANSLIWAELEQAFRGVHPYGGHAFRLKPKSLLIPQLTDTWPADDTNCGLMKPTYRNIPQPDPAVILCQILEEFGRVRPCRVEVDGMELLDWQAWLEAGLGKFDRSVFVRLFPKSDPWEYDDIAANESEFA